jgi:hypothetical protein
MAEPSGVNHQAPPFSVTDFIGELPTLLFSYRVYWQKTDDRQGFSPDSHSYLSEAVSYIFPLS